VRLKHSDLIETYREEDRPDVLVELNVIEQVVNICQTTILQDAWARKQDVTVHGWIYSLKDGLVQDLKMSIAADEELAPHYNRALAALWDGVTLVNDQAKREE
jgi:carbonic anhydrase